MDKHREKLIDLLENAHTEVATICDQSHCSECPGGMACDRGIMADHLIANGVTFATDTNDGDKWISVKDRLPENTADVIVCHKNGHVTMNAWLWTKWWFVNERNPITHWMPLPEPPKEE